MSGISQLSACHTSILSRPVVITDGTPLLTSTHLHPSFMVNLTIHQPDTILPAEH